MESFEVNYIVHLLFPLLFGAYVFFHCYNLKETGFLLVRADGSVFVAVVNNPDKMFLVK